MTQDLVDDKLTLVKILSNGLVTSNSQPAFTWANFDQVPWFYKQSGTKPNLVAKILATNFGNLWA